MPFRTCSGYPCTVALGIVSDPTVVVNCGMQRISCIGNVVAQPAGIEDDILLDRNSRIVLPFEVAVLAEGGFQAAVDLPDDVRLQPDSLGQVFLGALAGVSALGIATRRTRSGVARQKEAVVVTGGDAGRLVVGSQTRQHRVAYVPWIGKPRNQI
jgi:hypothetical protein